MLLAVCSMGVCHSRSAALFIGDSQSLAGFILWQSSNGVLIGRLKGTFNVKEDTAAAFGSAQARQQLFWQSIEVTEDHPFFGVGPGNFDQVSGQWHTTHNSLTLMSSEGGIPALVLYVLILWCGFKNLRATTRLARGQAVSSVLARALVRQFSRIRSRFFISQYGLQFFTLFLGRVHDSTSLDCTEIGHAIPQTNFARQLTSEKQFVTCGYARAEILLPDFLRFWPSRVPAELQRATDSTPKGPIHSRDLRTAQLFEVGSAHDFRAGGGLSKLLRLGGGVVHDKFSRNSKYEATGSVEKARNHFALAPCLYLATLRSPFSGYSSLCIW